MKKNYIAKQVLKFLNGLKISYLADVGREPAFFGQLDAGVLKVAMAISALDGNVTDDELAAFEKLAKKCRGYNAESAKALFREGLRLAGYVELAARTLSAKELLAVFLEESEQIMPNGFANGNACDVRRAFVMWTAMAMSDADFSQIERRAIHALADRVLDRIDERRAANTARQSLSPAFAAAYHESVSNEKDVFSLDSLKRVESLIAKLNSESDSTAAAADLKAFIRNG